MNLENEIKELIADILEIDKDKMLYERG